MLNDFANKLVVSFSDFSRIYNTPSYNHFENYSTVFFGFNGFWLSHHSFYFKCSVSDSTFYVFSTRPWCSHWSSMSLPGYLTLSYLFPLVVIYSCSQLRSRHLFYQKRGSLISLKQTLKFQVFSTS